MIVRKPKVRLVLSGSALALILGINDGRVLGVTYIADADVYEICVESKKHGEDVTEGATVPRKDVLVHGTCRYCGADTPLVEVINDLPATFNHQDPIVTVTEVEFSDVDGEFMLDDEPIPREDDVPF